jgi:hypothetical protein
MEAYLVSGVGVLSFTSGAWGVLSPTTLRELIRNLVILRPRRLQLFATFLIFYGTLMAGVALPPESKTQIAAAILGILLTAKGTVAFLMPYMEGLRSAYLSLLGIYAAKPLLWQTHCTVALLLGIVLMAWGTAEIV